MATIPTITLANGQVIPQLGLGLWKVTNAATFDDMFDAALKAGYRHFDSAQAYRNEQLLGAAIIRNGLVRSDIFVTTKIAVQHFGHRHTAQAFQGSLAKLQMEYIDLVLLHFPVPLLRKASWKTLESLYESGVIRGIGVSNYTIRHLEQLRRYARTMPVVNQVELHVFLQQPELLAYCHANQIIVEAYSPLAHARSMDNEVISRIAAKYTKSYAQIMLRWCIEQGAVVLPKSTTPSRITENAAIFDFSLDDEDLVALAAQNRNLRTCWNPTHVP
jgi:diketogulonate reductase-like aldo/keto reductase